MAIIKLSGTITDIRGSIGGTTFQRSRAGIIMKTKPHGFHGNTIKRSVQTNIMHYLQHQWIGLTAGQRAVWSKFAIARKVAYDNDPSRYLNGHELFLKYNFYRVLTGRSVATLPLVGYTTLSAMTVTLSLSGADLIMTGSRAIVSADEFLIIFVTFPVPPSLTNPGSRLRYIPNTWSSTDTYTLTSDYSGVFGRAPVAGETLYYRYRLVNTLGLYVLPWTLRKITLS